MCVSQDIKSIQNIESKSSVTELVKGAHEISSKICTVILQFGTIDYDENISTERLPS